MEKKIIENQELIFDVIDNVESYTKDKDFLSKTIRPLPKVQKESLLRYIRFGYESDIISGLDVREHNKKIPDHINMDSINEAIELSGIDRTIALLILKGIPTGLLDDYNCYLKYLLGNVFAEYFDSNFEYSSYGSLFRDILYFMKSIPPKNLFDEATLTNIVTAQVEELLEEYDLSDLLILSIRNNP